MSLDDAAVDKLLGTAITLLVGDKITEAGINRMSDVLKRVHANEITKEQARDMLRPSDADLAPIE